MDPSIAAIELELSGDKNYNAMDRIAVTNEHRFPLSEGLQSDPKARKRAELVASKLMQGAVVLNSEGAAVDVLQVDPLVNKSGGILVRAICLMHTMKKTVLSCKKILADHTKAALAVRNCNQLPALCNKGEPVRCITIHISNAVVQKARKPKENTPSASSMSAVSDTIIIGQHNMEEFFGPVLSRAMWPYRKPLPKVVRREGLAVPKGLASPKVVMGKGLGLGLGRKNGYCTLRTVPSVAQVQNSSTPLHAGVHRLVLAARMLAK